ncbi:hypothetical protein ADL21_00820 [Streptomyces albus subsp. albus]|nr:hypothetical protein ADL21_00820 [Streptomyces albus subsp. albus]
MTPTASPSTAGPALGPDLPAPADVLARAEWHDVLPDARVSVNAGWRLDWEQQQFDAAALQGTRWLSVRLRHGEIQIGPLWSPREAEEWSGCSGCAEYRDRLTVDHPLLGSWAHDLPVRTVPPLLAELLPIVLDDLRERPLGPGELVAAGDRGVRRHRIRRSVGCPVCGPSQRVGSAVTEVVPPPARPLVPRPAVNELGTRGGIPFPLRRDVLRERLVDHRFGPVLQVQRDDRAPFAMSNAILADSRSMGYGRALTFAETEPVAILEAYERLSGFPHEAQVIQKVPFDEIAGHALDPRRLGHYTTRQMTHPLSRLMPWTPRTPMDWVWGHRLGDGHPVLVPAEVGFYLYEYDRRLDYHGARRDRRRPRRRMHWFESSSGSALGGSYEEALLHSLFELAERDAFLLSWHRRRPLPVIDPHSVADAECRLMLDFITARGYETHLLVATQDLALPTVWALTTHADGGFPASFSAAGSGPDPVDAVRAALREVTQLVGCGGDWDRAEARTMLRDPWQVDTLEHHFQLYAEPAALGRIEEVLGGPRLDLAEAFPGWPDILRSASGGDVRESLRFMLDLYRKAGMEEVIGVDQSTRDHRDLGLASVKAVVPGIVPMCFGQAQQRLAGLPRFAAAMADAGQPVPTADDLPYDPHPFP